MYNMYNVTFYMELVFLTYLFWKINQHFNFIISINPRLILEECK